MVPHLVIRRIAVAVLLCTAGLLFGAGGVAPAVASGCLGASTAATKESRVQAARAVRCLVNAERRRRGLPPVRTSWKLQRSANLHSKAMLRTGIFEHRVPGEAHLAARIRRTGYLQRARRWAVGETLAWCGGDSANPATLVRSLMESPPHRAIILDRAFREVGVGLQDGIPEAAGRPGRGATLTLNFGLRRTF